MSSLVWQLRLQKSTQICSSPVFAYKQDWHTIGQYARTYPALFRHFINVLLHNIKFVHTKLILLMVSWQCVFINKINGMVKWTMWS